MVTTNGHESFGRTEVRAKLFVQSKLSTTIFLINLMHLKLVGRHMAKGIAECFNTMQQLFATTLKEISWGNVACERVCERDDLGVRA